jgi:hypothetical protein
MGPIGHKAFRPERRIILSDYAQVSLRPMREPAMQAYRGDMERTPDSILYIETDIPPQMTCRDWQRSKAHTPRRRLLSRLRGRRSAAASPARA